MKALRKFLSEAFFPLSFTCDVCGIETFNCNICPDCLKNLTFNNKDTCPVCGRKTALPEICLECKAKAPTFKKAVSAFVYENNCIPLIYKFKNGSGYLKEYFTDLLSEEVKNLPKFDLIVFVPMTQNAEYKRGYNQAELLAKSLSERIGVPVCGKVLTKVKDTPEQKNLSQKERAENLKGCFKIENKNDIKDKKLLLVDDVLTTGATANIIADKLLKAGAKQVYLATVASVEYKQKKNDKK